MNAMIVDGSVKVVLGWNVVKAGQVVRSFPADKRTSAQRCRDRLDKAYGACVHAVIAVTA